MDTHGSGFYMREQGMPWILACTMHVCVCVSVCLCTRAGLQSQVILPRPAQDGDKGKAQDTAKPAGTAAQTASATADIIDARDFVDAVPVVPSQIAHGTWAHHAHSRRARATGHGARLWCRSCQIPMGLAPPCEGCAIFVLPRSGRIA